MESRLDGIFRTSFRTTEQTDSWLGIRRDEDPQHGRKKNDGDHARDKESQQDETTVSVPALFVFLRDLLLQAGADHAPETPSPEKPQPSEDPTPAPPINPAASAAARAYQTTASHAPGQGLSMTDAAPPPPAASGPKISLNDGEIATIKRMMTDLETLASRGVSTIVIRQTGQLLQGLRDAIDGALNPPPPG